MNGVKQFFTSLLRYSSSNKKTAVFGILLLILAGFFSYKKLHAENGDDKYVLAAATKETIISSISGTGQVSATNQIEIKSKASGNVSTINVKEGETVQAGALLVSLDARDALLSLENEKINFEKLTKPADSLSIIQSENALEDSKLANEKAYTDGVSAVVGAFLDFPPIISGMNDLLYKAEGYLSEQANYDSATAMSAISKSGIEFDQTRKNYEKNMEIYKKFSGIDRATNEILVSGMYETVRSMVEALKDAKNAVDFIKNEKDDTSTKANSAETNITTWTNTMSTDLASLSSAKNSIQSTGRDMKEKSESLTKMKSGADPLDLRSEELALRGKENSLNDYYVRAPFDGVIAKLTVKKTDSVSSGGSLGTLVTREKVADISLNEIDAAKIKSGQKATLTFDAVDGLSISGQVASVDLIGTVSQGVVTYNVKIAFDTEDDRVKSGMSVSASIITDVKQDVLTIPNSAVKSSGDAHYIETISDLTSPTGPQGISSKSLPSSQNIEIGISNDTVTEIISGLNEGDLVVTRTISVGTAKSAAQAPSIFSAAGVRGTGGNAGRAVGR